MPSNKEPKRPLKIGVIGIGGMGGRHVNNLHALIATRGDSA